LNSILDYVDNFQIFDLMQAGIRVGVRLGKLA